MGRMDAAAFFFNVATSVLIVFANKSLLGGHGFSFATTLCALHLLASAAATWAAQAASLARPGHIPLADVLKYAVVANLSIASLNLSLLVNSVGFYQVAKLLIIPCVCGLESVLEKKPVTLPVAASIMTVVAGVAIVTVTDVQLHPLGLVVAVVSVLSSSLQQIMCGMMQRRFELSSHQLLSCTAHVQGLMLLLVGPHIDLWVTSLWIGDFAWSNPAVRQLALSCGLAVLVNISQFMCLGRFSAVAFQVLGHTKTILVLLASWWMLGERMTARKLSGMALAVLGMVMYGMTMTALKMKTSAAATAAAKQLAKQRQPGRELRQLAPKQLLSPFQAVQQAVSDSDGGCGDDKIKAVGVLPAAAAAVAAAVAGGAASAATLKQRLRPRTNKSSASPAVQRAKQQHQMQLRVSSLSPSGALSQAWLSRWELHGGFGAVNCSKLR